MLLVAPGLDSPLPLRDQLLLRLGNSIYWVCICPHMPPSIFPLPREGDRHVLLGRRGVRRESHSTRSLKREFSILSRTKKLYRARTLYDLENLHWSIPWLRISIVNSCASRNEGKCLAWAKERVGQVLSFKLSRPRVWRGSMYEKSHPYVDLTLLGSLHSLTGHFTQEKLVKEENSPTSFIGK